MKKQFKAESKKLMDLMINSIYTNKEIFLRELISNASDAIDKLYYTSLTDKSIKIKKDKLKIEIKLDKERRTITIIDNGIGMTKDELETNLGTIAKSGSEDFKKLIDKKDNNIIGQFGVGFYSAFMVSKEVEVTSKKYNENTSYTWTSNGLDGYEIKESDSKETGTTIVLTLKDDTEEENYSKYLEEYTIDTLIKKYSNYITYKIEMNDKVLNELVPIWKRTDAKDEEYDTFYEDKFNDYNKPLKTIKSKVEGLVSYNALLYIPSKVPYNYMTKNFEKGLQLYSNGVLIMESCKDLLPDYYSFVKGIVDSEDLSLNISREMLQQDRTLKQIAKSIDNKITKELESMLKNEREQYESFYNEFGVQIKYGVYDKFGLEKDKLKDLLLFYSSNDKKYTTLKEYVDRMPSNQEKIYYVCGETLDIIDTLPQVEEYKKKGYELLYCNSYIDEFVMQTLSTYNDKQLLNISASNDELLDEEEKEEQKKNNESKKDLLSKIKESISDVKEVKFTNKLTNNPVCLTATGNISIEMEKVLNAMQKDESVKADKVLEINQNHKIASKLEKLYNDKNYEELSKLSKILYEEARLIEGLPITNPTELTSLIIDELSK